jgi:hypothetical protein
LPLCPAHPRRPTSPSPDVNHSRSDPAQNPGSTRPPPPKARLKQRLASHRHLLNANDTIAHRCYLTGQCMSGCPCALAALITVAHC